MKEKLHYKELLEIEKITHELATALNKLQYIHPSIAIFGSARTHQDSPYYIMTENLAYLAAGKGFAILTGGGPGIMEAANKGAKKAGGTSIGLCIDLLESEPMNQYVDDHYGIQFNHFFLRKALFLRYAKGIVFLPGGYGTLDELMEFLLMISVKKIPQIPLYLLGKEYWQDFVKWIHKFLLERKLVSEPFVSMLQMTDDPEEIIEGLCKFVETEKTIVSS